MPAAAALLVSACTLTDDSFEPSPVSRVGGELSPDLPSPPASTPEDGEASPLPADTNAETLDGVPLAPAAPGDDPRGASSASGSDDGISSGDDGRADAGASPAPVEDGALDPSSPAAPVLPPPAAPCDGSEFGGSCYQLFPELASWTVAEQRCIAWGGHLASVESPEEDDFISGWPAILGIPVADGSGVWLGATDAALDGDFRWWDDGELRFESWAPNQPDNGIGVDCVEKRNDGTALWYDRRCADALAFVCERPL